MLERERMPICAVGSSYEARQIVSWYNKQGVPAFIRPCLNSKVVQMFGGGYPFYVVTDAEHIEMALSLYKENCGRYDPITGTIYERAAWDIG